MPSHVHIPAGAVPHRPVRPLTAEESARIRPPATSAQLDGLRRSVEARRLDAKRLPAAGALRTPRLPAADNGWTR